MSTIVNFADLRNRVQNDPDFLALDAEVQSEALKDAQFQSAEQIIDKHVFEMVQPARKPRNRKKAIPAPVVE